MAAVKLEPDGIVTRTFSPRDDPPHALTTASVVAHTAIVSRRLTWKRERMLKQDGSGHGIDVSLAAAGRAAHLANGPECRGGGESLVHETHRQTGSFLELCSHVSRFDRSGRVITLLIEGQADHESLDLELGAAPDHLSDRRPLPAAPLDETRGRRDGAGRVADGETDATITVIDSEYPRRE
jgi:hypothetical protein